MLKRFLRSTHSSVTFAALLIGIASLLSRLMGVIRDRLLSGTFGASRDLDIYYAAFRVPDLVYNLVVGGVITAAFIPVFTQYLGRHASPDDGVGEEASKLADALISALGLLLVVGGLAGVLLAPWFVPKITPGFNEADAYRVTQLTRLMFLSPFFLGLSNVYGGILQTKRRFAVYALAPILYNVGIIGGTLLLAPRYGIMGPTVGVIAGSFLHLSVQMYAAWRAGYRWSLSRDIAHAGVRKIGRLTLPRLVSLGAAQANLLILTSIASTLGAGSISVFTLANNLQLFPTGIIGVSFAVAAFPAISELAAQHKKEEFGLALARTVKNILFLIIPATVGILLLRAQIVRVVLGTGRFDWGDTIATADALAFFGVSLFAQALWPLLARACFALGDAMSPLWAVIAGVAIERLAAWQLVQHGFSTPGLALAFSIGSIFTTVWVWSSLRHAVGRSLGEAGIIKSAALTSVAALFMAGAMQGAKIVIAGMVDMRTGAGIFTQGLGAGVIGIAVFASAAFIMGSEEARSVVAMYSRRFAPAPVPEVHVEDGSIGA
ncbi:MAG: hypothetical protein RLZZ324_985 [Candidatus Parcubacteria bacterium]|jgi:putative peptidoglycan lipid II flippase